MIRKLYKIFALAMGLSAAHIIARHMRRAAAADLCALANGLNIPAVICLQYKWFVTLWNDS